MLKSLYTWIHLSDIHMCHGHAEHQYDQKRVLDALKDDICSERAGEPPAQALFVTGDLTLSGATKSLGEFVVATEWLLAVADAIKISAKEIYAIPGNHDIQRSVSAADKDIARLIAALRGGNEPIDTALDDAEKPGASLANYLEASKTFCIDRSNLFWRENLKGSEGLRIALVGLNTAMLCQGNTDLGKLALGSKQLTLLNRDSATVLITMTHHPLDWLRDCKNASEWIRSKADVHLFGHIHDQATEHLRSGGANQITSVCAGAAHGEASEPGNHGYNNASIGLDDAGKLYLTVWPRRWSSGNKRFQLDVDNVGKDEPSVTHPLNIDFKVTAPRKKSKPKRKLS